MPRRLQLALWLQYLYFLRFSILAWLFLPLLCVLDWRGVTSNITRSILTPESGWQTFYATFFIIALQMTVLVTARNIVRNGEDRFAASAPCGLSSALTSFHSEKHHSTLNKSQNTSGPSIN